jgi:aminopeptidase N
LGTSPINLNRKTNHGTPVIIYAEHGKESYLEYPLNASIEALEFFEEYFDTLYPLPVFQSIAVPDFGFCAMENYGLLVYHETCLLGRSNNSMEYWMDATVIIFHEISHMWCGNLVSPDWWNNIWLNEGFATYLSYISAENLHSEWNYMSTWTILVRYLALDFDQSNYTHPIYTSYESEAEIASSFDLINYEKAGCVIMSLVNYIGEDKFKEAMREWYKRNANQSVSTEKYMSFLDEITQINITEWMNTWLTQSHYPLVSVNGKTLTQSTFSYDGSTKGNICKIPLSMNNHTDFLFDTETKTIEDAPEWFVLNNDKQAFCRVIYDKDSFSKIMENLKEINGTAQAILLQDYFNFACANLVDFTGVIGRIVVCV